MYYTLPIEKCNYDDIVICGMHIFSTVQAHKK